MARLMVEAPVQVQKTCSRSCSVICNVHGATHIKEGMKRCKLHDDLTIMMCMMYDSTLRSADIKVPLLGLLLY
jgi:hypothetical protein